MAKPKKILIGIASTNDQAARNMANQLADVMQLKPWHLQQPVFDSIAGLLGMNAHDVAHTALDTPVPMFKTRLGTLIERLQISLRTMNHDFLVARLVERMHPAQGSYLYSGDLISGITTSHEAAWLRAKGGVLVHLVDATDRTQRPPVFDHDVVIPVERTTSAEDLSHAIAATRAAMHQKSTAAA